MSNGEDKIGSIMVTFLRHCCISRSELLHGVLVGFLARARRLRQDFRREEQELSQNPKFECRIVVGVYPKLYTTIL